MASVISFPTLKPASLIEVNIVSIASSVPPLKFGAKPPSSPTAVLSPFFFRIDFKVWNISTPYLRASVKELAPTGLIINS